MSSEEFLAESCYYCGVEIINVEEIFVDEEDHYICSKCKRKLKIEAKKCLEYSEDRL
jgi:DNA-directed RNA polymerase subunit RPC12/RpoP